MPDPIKNTLHVKEGLARLLTQFQGQPNFASLLSSYLVQIQELEDMFFELLLERRLDIAVGTQLDGIGSIVEVVRAGRNDDAYRAAIRAHIQVLRLNSRIEDLILVVTLALPDATLEVVERYPAGIEIHVTSDVDIDLGAQVAAIVKPQKGGGVAFRFYWHAAPARFRYSPTGTLIASSANGYGNGEYSGVR